MDCTKCVHSHLLFGQLLYGLKSSIMGCVSIFLQFCGLKSSRDSVNRPLGQKASQSYRECIVKGYWRNVSCVNSMLKLPSQIWFWKPARKLLLECNIICMVVYILKQDMHSNKSPHKYIPSIVWPAYMADACIIQYISYGKLTVSIFYFVYFHY